MKLGSKLVLQTVLPAVAAVAILLAIVTQVTSSALRDAAERGLAAVAEARREDLQNHLERMRDDIVAMGNAPAVIEATRQFSAAFAACGTAADTQLQQFYDNDVQAAGSNPGVDLQPPPAMPAAAATPRRMPRTTDFSASATPPTAGTTCCSSTAREMSSIRCARTTISPPTCCTDRGKTPAWHARRRLP
jgi:hypothetical protein